MAESMVGLKRTHRCTEVSSADIGSTVTVMGWVAKRRNLGSLIFVDLRDRSGLLQILFDENIIGKEGFDKAYTLRNEFVIAVVGKVIKRSGAVNDNLKTGDIEIAAESLRILSESETLSSAVWSAPPTMKLAVEPLWLRVKGVSPAPRAATSERERVEVQRSVEKTTVSMRSERRSVKSERTPCRDAVSWVTSM